MGYTYYIQDPHKHAVTTCYIDDIEFYVCATSNKHITIIIPSYEF